MSTHTDVYVTCNGRVPSSKTKSGTVSCPAEVKGGEQPDGSWAWPHTQAEARKLAKAQGWLHVPYPRLSFLAEDFCPAHEDQAKAKADERGVRIVRGKAPVAAETGGAG